MFCVTSSIHLHKHGLQMSLAKYNDVKHLPFGCSFQGLPQWIICLHPNRFCANSSLGPSKCSLVLKSWRIVQNLRRICTVFLCKTWGLEERDLSVSIKVLLVPTQDDNNVLTGQHPGITQPCGQSVICFSTEDNRESRHILGKNVTKQKRAGERERSAITVTDWLFLPCDIIDQKGSCCSPVVTSGHRSESHKKKE